MLVTCRAVVAIDRRRCIIMHQHPYILRPRDNEEIRSKQLNTIRRRLNDLRIAAILDFDRLPSDPPRDPLRVEAMAGTVPTISEATTTITMLTTMNLR